MNSFLSKILAVLIIPTLVVDSAFCAGISGKRPLAPHSSQSHYTFEKQAFQSVSLWQSRMKYAWKTMRFVRMSTARPYGSFPSIVQMEKKGPTDSGHRHKGITQAELALQIAAHLESKGVSRADFAAYRAEREHTGKEKIIGGILTDAIGATFDSRIFISLTNQQMQAFLDEIQQLLPEVAESPQSPVKNQELSATDLEAMTDPKGADQRKPIRIWNSRGGVHGKWDVLEFWEVLAALRQRPHPAIRVWIEKQGQGLDGIAGSWQFDTKPQICHTIMGPGYTPPLSSKSLVWVQRGDTQWRIWLDPSLPPTRLRIKMHSEDGSGPEFTIFANYRGAAAVRYLSDFTFFLLDVDEITGAFTFQIQTRGDPDNLIESPTNPATHIFLDAPEQSEISLDRHQTAIAVENWLHRMIDPQGTGRLQRLIRPIRKVLVPFQEQLEFFVFGAVASFIPWITNGVFSHTTVMAILVPFAFRYAALFGIAHRGPAWLKLLASLWSMGSIGLFVSGWFSLDLTYAALALAQVLFNLLAPTWLDYRFSLDTLDRLLRRDPGMNALGILHALEVTLYQATLSPQTPRFMIENLRQLRLEAEESRYTLERLIEDGIETRAFLQSAGGIVIGREVHEDYQRWRRQFANLIQRLPNEMEVLPANFATLRADALTISTTLTALENGLPHLAQFPYGPLTFILPERFFANGPTTRLNRFNGTPYIPANEFTPARTPGAWWRGQTPPVLIPPAALREILSLILRATGPADIYFPSSPDFPRVGDDRVIDYHAEPVLDRYFGFMRALDIVVQVSSENGLHMGTPQLEGDSRFQFARAIAARYGGQIFVRAGQTHTPISFEDAMALYTGSSPVENGWNRLYAHTGEVVVRIPAYTFTGLRHAVLRRWTRSLSRIALIPILAFGLLISAFFTYQDVTRERHMAEHDLSASTPKPFQHLALQNWPYSLTRMARRLAYVGKDPATIFDVLADNPYWWSGSRGSPLIRRDSYANDPSIEAELLRWEGADAFMERHMTLERLIRVELQRPVANRTQKRQAMEKLNALWTQWGIYWRYPAHRQKALQVGVELLPDSEYPWRRVLMIEHLKKALDRSKRLMPIHILRPAKTTHVPAGKAVALAA